MPHFELAADLEPYREFIEKNARENTGRGTSMAGQAQIFALVSEKVRTMFGSGELDPEHVAHWCAEYRAGASEERERIKEIDERFGGVAEYRFIVQKAKFGPFADPESRPNAEDVAEMLVRARTQS